MKKILLILFLSTVYINIVSAREGRSQWTEKEAWQWQKWVGVLKGFNEPEPGYPGMTRKDVLKKASEIGFNCVRFWVKGNTVEKQVRYISEMAHDAALYGLRVSPVLSIEYTIYSIRDSVEAKIKLVEYVKHIVGAFAKDRRIVLWDIWNEPDFNDSVSTYRQMYWIAQTVKLCRKESPVQPITASIFWDDGIKHIDTVSVVYKKRCEVEAMMDIHNFHDYCCSYNHMQSVRSTINRLLKISNRPLVCTECLDRVDGSTVPRTLASFSEYHVNFFLWGLYICDRNWSVKWGRSSYYPYEPIFHDLLHPDGEPYDWRDLMCIKDYRFVSKGKEIYPDAEITERWTKDRAWKWMASGPIKGVSFDSLISGLAWLNKYVSVNSIPAYNCLSIKFDYNEWKSHPFDFFYKVDSLLKMAESCKMTVLPILLTDDDVIYKDTSLVNYVSQVIRHYYNDYRIKGWDIYYHPGEKEKDSKKLFGLLTLLFRYARYEVPNQPLMATPFVEVKQFATQFNYQQALLHGGDGGWNYLVFKNGGSCDLCYNIWKWSDVISFSSNQDAAEMGWLLSISYRYGRPIISEYNSLSSENVKYALSMFSLSHVFWFSKVDMSKNCIENFDFKSICTSK